MAELSPSSERRSSIGPMAESLEVQLDKMTIALVKIKGTLPFHDKIKSEFNEAIDLEWKLATMKNSAETILMWPKFEKKQKI